MAKAAAKKADKTVDEADAIAKQIGRLKIESWRVERIIPYDKNPRKIGPEAVAKVAGSIKRFGFNAPIGVDEDGVILYGHTRLQAAKHLGLKVAPVVVLASLTEVQKKEFRIADNRVAEESEWDKGLLSTELEAIRAEAGDLMATGFDAGELSKLVEGLSVDMPEVDSAASSKAAPAQAEGGTKGTAADNPELPTSVIDAGGDFVKLAERIFRWYCPAGGVVLSPFAGIPGTAAAAQAVGLELHDVPIAQLARSVLADLIFAVPSAPDGDFPGWCEAYAAELDAAATRLKPGRFVAVFIGDARSGDGTCYGLPWLTVEYGMRAGLKLHDTAAVILPGAEASDWALSRELAAQHAHLFVFVKGDAKVATAAIAGA